ncbi:MAG: V-type ATP synthase subunit D [Candidatus Hydrogenedentes bacterium]|nr:V-type ATP synthase subunit D [Candidatus Hydrogenedentota bacterium]
MSMDNVAPTRMNMLLLKGQIKMAADGVGLLKGKRDALMQELLKRARALALMRDELHARGRAAADAMAMARAVRGTPELKSAAVAGRRELLISVEAEKVWGLALGRIDMEGIVRTPAKRGMGLLDTSAQVQEASEASEEMLSQLLICAPLERNLQIVGEEVKKVSRRINALEEYLLPRLRGQLRGIASVLDEREREDTFRLKKIKGKKAVQKRKAQADAAAAAAAAAQGAE